MIIKTEAVVLRAVKFGESSRIVTFFTRDFGKIAGMVKGARRSGNRFGSTLQPMSQVSVVIYRKPGREVQTVSQCDHLRIHKRITSDLDRISTGMQMVELTGMVLHDEEENREVYGLLTAALGKLDRETISPWALFYDYEVQLSGALGFRTDFSRCAGCGRQVAEFLGIADTVKIDIGRGGPVCRSCDSPALRGVLLSPDEMKFFLGLTPGRLSPNQPMSDVRVWRSDQIEKFISEYFAYHMAGYRKLRSGEILRS